MLPKAKCAGVLPLLVIFLALESSMASVASARGAEGVLGGSGVSGAVIPSATLLEDVQASSFLELSTTGPGMEAYVRLGAIFAATALFSTYALYSVLDAMMFFEVVGDKKAMLSFEEFCQLTTHAGFDGMREDNTDNGGETDAFGLPPLDFDTDTAKRYAEFRHLHSIDGRNIDQDVDSDGDLDMNDRAIFLARLQLEIDAYKTYQKSTVVLKKNHRALSMRLVGPALIYLVLYLSSLYRAFLLGKNVSE